MRLKDNILFLNFLSILLAVCTINASCAESKSITGEESPTLVENVEVSSVSFSVDDSTITASPDIRTNVEKLSDTDPRTRRNAVIYLGSERKKENLARLIEMIDDENLDVRRAVINALANFGDKSASEHLIKKYTVESNLSAKMNIIIALGKLKDPKSIPLLKTLLQDPYPPFRNESVRALGNINSPDTYESLVKMLDDEAEGVRVITADVVAELKISSAVLLLEKNLDDPVSVVRRSCAKSLGEVGKTSSLPVLKKLLEDKDASVVAAAEESIKKINNRMSLNKTSK